MRSYFKALLDLMDSIHFQIYNYKAFHSTHHQLPILFPIPVILILFFLIVQILLLLWRPSQATYGMLDLVIQISMSQECLFLGYSTSHKGYKCFSSSGRLFISKDVVFNEIRFPYTDLFESSSVSSTIPSSSTHFSQFHSSGSLSTGHFYCFFSTASIETFVSVDNSVSVENSASSQPVSVDNSVSNHDLLSDGGSNTAQHQTVYLLVYVDDIIITGSSSMLIQKLTSKLNSSFAFKHLGKLDYFLGIEVKALPGNSLVLTQSKSAVGALQYTTITRPEISFAVNKVNLYLLEVFVMLTGPQMLMTEVIFCDNQSSVALTHNPVLHTRTKHMEIDVFFVRERVLTKQLIVHHIPGLDQWTDALTKPFSPTRFQFLKGKLNVIDLSSKSQPP
ncbi:putative mitochondrial protein [Glycine soja]|uniref:Putative mitochondrial protein n=1 Tax=Glycine soja TaxID=3848 RepID=A0A445HAA4_GLYSO|nr:putative mitochondrial protein [Glycine soja]